MGLSPIERAESVRRQADGVELRWMTPDDVDAVVAAADLFDHEVGAEWAGTFLAEPTHHICIAYEDGAPAGFVSGVEMTHPDKGTEMFLYELGVDDRFRRRGMGKALVEALAGRARERGCYGMWVLTEPDNEAAIATYASTGAEEESRMVLLSWAFTEG